MSKELDDQLDLFPPKNQEGPLMSVQEVANLLGVTPEALKKHIRNLFPQLIQNGVQTFLSEFQVFQIKKQMRPTTKVVAAVTDLEMHQKTLEVLLWQQSRISDLNNALSEMRPKAEFHDLVTNSDECYTVDEAVHLLKLTVGRNKFYNILRTDKILRTNPRNEPYEEFISRGYFKVILKNIQIKHSDSTEENKPITVTLITGKGLSWLSKKYEGLRIREVLNV